MTVLLLPIDWIAPELRVAWVLVPMSRLSSCFESLPTEPAMTFEVQREP
jgi:hypothetical protein